MESSNSSLCDCVDSWLSETLLEGILMPIIGFAGLIGNILVLYVYRWWKYDNFSIVKIYEFPFAFKEWLRRPCFQTMQHQEFNFPPSSLNPGSCGFSDYSSNDLGLHSHRNMESNLSWQWLSQILLSSSIQEYNIFSGDIFTCFYSCWEISCCVQVRWNWMFHILLLNVDHFCIGNWS